MSMGTSAPNVILPGVGFVGSHQMPAAYAALTEGLAALTQSFPG
jgi:hypothetical protein